jgi:hypothetical protein
MTMMTRQQHADALRMAAAKLEVLADCVAAEEYPVDFNLEMAAALQYIGLVVNVMDGPEAACHIQAAAGAQMAEAAARSGGGRG